MSVSESVCVYCVSAFIEFCVYVLCINMCAETRVNFTPLHIHTRTLAHIKFVKQ